MKTNLISLISDQTIPTVQFIKKKVDEPIFIKTNGMEANGVSNCILNGCDLKDNVLRCM